MSTGTTTMPDAVGYTVKELFEKIDKKLDVMSVVISSKADHSDVEKLREEFDALEKRYFKLESGVTTKEAVEANENRLEQNERKISANRTMLIIGLLGLIAQLIATAALFVQIKH